jgi:hypothetical protein
VQLINQPVSIVPFPSSPENSTTSRILIVTATLKHYTTFPTRLITLNPGNSVSLFPTHPSSHYIINVSYFRPPRGRRSHPNTPGSRFVLARRHLSRPRNWCLLPRARSIFTRTQPATVTIKRQRGACSIPTVA